MTLTSEPGEVRRPARLGSHSLGWAVAAVMLLKQAMQELGLSARAHDKILRTARTIADLEEAPDVTATHLAEAVQYRRLDRNLFA